MGKDGKDKLKQKQVSGAEEALYKLHTLYPFHYTIEFSAADSVRDAYWPDNWMVTVSGIDASDETVVGLSEKSLAEAVESAVAKARTDKVTK